MNELVTTTLRDTPVQDETIPRDATVRNCSLIRSASASVMLIPFRYQLLTALVFGPLATAFYFETQFYPVPVWSLFSEAVAGEGRVYYVLRGETTSGQELDICAVQLTDALKSRNHTLVGYVMANNSLYIESPHPENIKYLSRSDQSDRVIPRGLRVPDLLSAWGEIYNMSLDPPDGSRLQAIRLDAYQWSGKAYSDYAQPRETYRVEL